MLTTYTQHWMNALIVQRHQNCCVCVCLAGTKCCYNIVESTNNDNNKNQQQHSKKCSLSAYICHNNTIHYKLICPESSNIPNIAEWIDSRFQVQLHDVIPYHLECNLNSDAWTLVKVNIYMALLSCSYDVVVVVVVLGDGKPTIPDWRHTKLQLVNDLCRTADEERR